MHIQQLCGAAWSSRWLMVQLTNGQHTCKLVFKPKPIYWTYVETINLFSLYLMNFILHTMLDAAGVVLRVHYTSIKCDVLFSQGSVGTVFRWDGHFSFLPLYNSAKIIKIDQGFTKLWSQMYCHLFMVHGVHLVLSVIHIIFNTLLEFITRWHGSARVF